MLLNFSDSVLTLFHLRCVAPHLQADENFDIAGIAAGLGGVNAPLAKGRRVLDAFCYTGGFGLHAARAGASAPRT